MESADLQAIQLDRSCEQEVGLCQVASFGMPVV